MGRNFFHSRCKSWCRKMQTPWNKVGTTSLSLNTNSLAKLKQFLIPISASHISLTSYLIYFWSLTWKPQDWLKRRDLAILRLTYAVLFFYFFLQEKAQCLQKALASQADKSTQTELFGHDVSSCIEQYFFVFNHLYGCSKFCQPVCLCYCCVHALI